MRYYTLRSMPEYGIHTGCCNGDPCILGLIAPYAVMLLFNEYGTFVRLRKKVLMPASEDAMEMVRSYDPLKRFRRFRRRTIGRGTFREEGIQVLRFRVDLVLPLLDPMNGSAPRLCRIGIDDLPPDTVNYVVERMDSTQVFKDIVSELAIWRSSGMFRFWWGNGLDIDSNGTCVSS